ncbi:hypothetical protein [Campylobacter sp. 19-13652]|uniref:hypothetical protein n=1 Tax=Campylobacter sp. 19-13652 TaxID=2840180 RepID=UPI001C759D5A|nr:hypothetical protein [Campylobacter sp. 19-13652]BCX80057.1 hypothetical protein LBC_15190 [Campylobacter sp. 19-13652]
MKKVILISAIFLISCGDDINILRDDFYEWCKANKLSNNNSKQFCDCAFDFYISHFSDKEIKFMLRDTDGLFGQDDFYGYYNIKFKMERVHSSILEKSFDYLNFMNKCIK